MSHLPEQPLSPLDGRYKKAVAGLGDHLSEAGLNRARVQVEVEWLIYLTDHEYFGSSRLDPEQAVPCARSSPSSARPRSMSSPASRRPPATT